MKTLKTLALVTAVSAGSLGTGGALATSQGVLAQSSEGSFQIVFPNVVSARVWGLKDILLDGDEGPSAKAGYDFCVFANASTVLKETYTMTVTSDNDYTLIGSGGGTIDYELSITDGYRVTADKNGSTTMKAGELPTQPNPSLEVCEKPNTRLNVWFATLPDNPPADVFTDDITITVSVD